MWKNFCREKKMWRPLQHEAPGTEELSLRTLRKGFWNVQRPLQSHKKHTRDGAQFKKRHITTIVQSKKTLLTFCFNLTLNIFALGSERVPLWNVWKSLQIEGSEEHPLRQRSSRRRRPSLSRVWSPFCQIWQSFITTCLKQTGDHMEVYRLVRSTTTTQRWFLTTLSLRRRGLSGDSFHSLRFVWSFIFSSSVKKETNHSNEHQVLKFCIGNPTLQLKSFFLPKIYIEDIFGNLTHILWEFSCKLCIHIWREGCSPSK